VWPKLSVAPATLGSSTEEEYDDYYEDTRVKEHDEEDVSGKKLRGGKATVVERRDENELEEELEEDNELGEEDEAVEDEEDEDEASKDDDNEYTNVETEEVDESQAVVKDEQQQQPAASIFELSLFGNKSPSDFQMYTPHAPTCSQPLDAKSVSYTLVSQLSNDRLWMVQYYCERWGVDNPISIAVLTDRLADEIKSELVSLGCSEQNLTVQTVRKTRYDPTGKEYPVNLLRNLAFSAVKTSHITYADVDFWPASDLHSILSDEKTKERLASDSKLATVLPVFQLNRQCESYNKVCRERNIPQMPKDKEELINLIQKKAVSTTQLGSNGHSSTKYKTWMNQKTGTFVDLPCFKSNKYEPYLTVRYCSDLPPFQEGFTGYGKNKITVSLCAFADAYKIAR